MNSKLFYAFLCFITISTILVLHLYRHENVHEAIYDSFGVTHESKYNLDLSASVSAVNYTLNCDSTCVALHLQNEIVAYNLEPIIALLVLIFLVLVWVAAESFERNNVGR